MIYFFSSAKIIYRNKMRTPTTPRLLITDGNYCWPAAAVVVWPPERISVEIRVGSPNARKNTSTPRVKCTTPVVRTPTTNRRPPARTPTTPHTEQSRTVGVDPPPAAGPGCRPATAALRRVSEIGSRATRPWRPSEKVFRISLSHGVRAYN